MGRLLYTSVLNNDVPVIQGGLMWILILAVVINTGDRPSLWRAQPGDKGDQWLTPQSKHEHEAPSPRRPAKSHRPNVLSLLIRGSRGRSWTFNFGAVMLVLIIVTLLLTPLDRAARSRRAGPVKPAVRTVGEPLVRDRPPGTRRPVPVDVGWPVLGDDRGHHVGGVCGDRRHHRCGGGPTWRLARRAA